MLTVFVPLSTDPLPPMLTAYKKTRAYRTTKFVQGKLQLPVAAVESAPPAHSPNNPENTNAAKQTLATQKPPVYHNKTIVETCLGTKTITADTKMPDSDVGSQTRMSEMEYIPRLELAVLAGDS